MTAMLTALTLLAALQGYAREHYPGRELDRFLYVSVPNQRMYLVEDWIFTRTFDVSTALAGTGSRKGSQKTPLGLHEVCEKHGEGVPLGGILEARSYTGRQARIHNDDTDVEADDVTTRVLWLCGLEPGLNQGGEVDSRERYIYIHGTPEEGLIGRPASHGCVRMRNREVVELYRRVPVGTPVLILDQ